MAKADHAAQIAQQRPGQSNAAYNQSGNDQAHDVVVLAQQQRHANIRKHTSGQRYLACFHPRLPAEPNRPFGNTNNTSKNSTMPTSSCRAELARVMVSASATPSSKAPTSTPGIRSAEHTSELKSQMRISYDDFCL